MILGGITSLLYSKGGQGNYKLTGIVTVNGVPAARKVRLFEFPNLHLIDAAYSSDTTGRYTFSNIGQRPAGGATYGLLAVDHAGAYDPEAKVSLVAEAMT